MYDSGGASKRRRRYRGAEEEEMEGTELRDLGAHLTKVLNPP